MQFVPYSVSMRARGFVHDPSNRNPFVSSWVPAGCTKADRRRAEMTKKADKVIDVLARFVERWVQQSRRARREYAIRKAGEDWTRGVWSIHWGNLMYEEEERILAMTEPEFLAEAQFRIARCKASNTGVFPVIEWIRSMRIQREEKKKTQARLVEYSMVAREIGIKVFVGSVFLGYF
jgi:hypothetical protein